MNWIRWWLLVKFAQTLLKFILFKTDQISKMINVKSYINCWSSSWYSPWNGFREKGKIPKYHCKFHMPFLPEANQVKFSPAWVFSFQFCDLFIAVCSIVHCLCPSTSCCLFIFMVFGGKSSYLRRLLERWVLLQDNVCQSKWPFSENLTEWSQQGEIK